jgi:hypothetical protein
VKDVAHDRARKKRADLPERLADHDTADGRIDGDLGIVAGVGATFSGQSPRGAAEVRVRYLETAGIFLTYEDGFGAASSDPVRVFATGLEMRPLFLGRWVTGNEMGLAWTDLVVDSFGLELGAFFEQPPGQSFASSAASRGVQVGIGLEFPLIARANGLWIDAHGGVRWSDNVLGGAAIGGPSDRAFYFSITLAFHGLVVAHIVDAHDRAP